MCCVSEHEGSIILNERCNLPVIHDGSYIAQCTKAF
jgi:hypothetical protein